MFVGSVVKRGGGVRFGMGVVGFVDDRVVFDERGGFGSICFVLIVWIVWRGEVYSAYF